MRKLSVIPVVVVLSLLCSLAPARENAGRIIIHPEDYMPDPSGYVEPMPLDRTLKLVFVLTGPDAEKQITLLCATTVYGAEATAGEGDTFNIGGTLRMVRNTEVLVTFDFETETGESAFSGSGSVKIKLGESKTVFTSGGFQVSVHVELDSD